jgi:predicted TPR repeat methyltransferase
MVKILPFILLALLVLQLEVAVSFLYGLSGVCPVQRFLSVHGSSSGTDVEDVMTGTIDRVSYNAYQMESKSRLNEKEDGEDGRDSGDNMYIATARLIHEVDLRKEGEESDVPLMCAKMFHRTNGPVPRATTSTIIRIDSEESEKCGIDADAFFSVLEESLKWYLDNGGRIRRTSIAFEKDSFYSKWLAEIGFVNSPLFTDEFTQLHSSTLSRLSNYGVQSCEPETLLKHLESRLKSGLGNICTLNDLLGRLHHDLGAPEKSIPYYTQALLADKNSSAVFRNLGSAYQATGDTQLAFASFQQAVQLNPDDAAVYLKLAFFYEDFAKKDWEDAAEHALRCYHYYLDNVDGEDTSVLTRLGNLLIREHKNKEALVVYEKVLLLDKSLHNVWFNKAHAHIRMGETTKATEALERTLELNPGITAASHMLNALSKERATIIATVDENYVKDLFNNYGAEYDDHVKKLLYSAPRVIRQELAKIFKGRYNIDLGDVPQEIDGCTTIISTIKIKGELDILDLGCGTGLAGAWLKDYAKHLVGVDISEGMATVAEQKMIYNELNVMSLMEYFEQTPAESQFDLLVASDVLSYIGRLDALFGQVVERVRAGGYFAFTVERVDESAPDITDFVLQQTGRFGYKKNYIDNLLQSFKGLDVLVSREFSPRLDAGEPVQGMLYIVQKQE